MVRPRCQGEESFFGRLKQEYPRLKKKHDIHWMDIKRPLLLEPCVDYKLTKRCVRVNLVGPQVCGREHIAHLRFVRMYNPFLNSNGIYYSPFTVCSKYTHFLVRTTINNFNQPLKTEFNKINNF